MILGSLKDRFQSATFRILFACFFLSFSINQQYILWFVTQKYAYRNALTKSKKIFISAGEIKKIKIVSALSSQKSDNWSQSEFISFFLRYLSSKVVFFLQGWEFADKANWWRRRASEGLLSLQAAQIQVRMRQLLSFKTLSPSPGSTDLGAHASTSELQKDFSHSRQHIFRCACINF